MGFKAAGKGMMGKGGILKGFGFLGGIFKMLFFGVFLIILLAVGFVAYLILKRKTDNHQRFYNEKNKKEDDIIDAEIIDTHPVKK